MSLYERFTFRGKTLDRLTIAALMAVEKDLGYEQTIIQGSYNSGVGASAGTHDGGGAIDVVWVDIKRKVRAHRRHGWDFWPRPALPGVWSAHAHGILHGNDKASSGAKAQMVEYANGQDGLAGSGRDPYWRPKGAPIVFNYKRSALISWKRLNGIAGHKDGKAFTNSGAREVEVIARALRGFGMSLGDHRKGRMDKPLLNAIERFKDIRNIRTEVEAPLSPKVCYALCVPTKEK